MQKKPFSHKPYRTINVLVGISIGAAVKLDHHIHLGGSVNIAQKEVNQIRGKISIASSSDCLYGQLYAISAVLWGALKQVS